ncbi:ribonuclease HII [Petrocella sp. FN5]|uniref:ribonuclease HII n=1 Tax=Petrocella sp. FN5 TaxID=3032002 RepID=UPI0023DAF17F|nr:ribonuclease HII [Petrocella sp. FN5]MDF1616378.1 ribonuclease HII [Petrocella sp. FN5]
MDTLPINTIKKIYKETDVYGLDAFIKRFKEDDRAGVKHLVDCSRKKIHAYNTELDRMERMRTYEYKYDHLEYICGIDEVGRGPLAGPVVTAAVILKKDTKLLYINDSKKLSEKMREMLYDQIMDEAIAVSIGLESVETIDSINILQATYKAMKKAVTNLNTKPDILLVDAVTIPDIKLKQLPIIKGDEKSISIAAASIIAKVTRDRMMKDYHEIFPAYDFDKNKGYGSTRHIEAIKKVGPCSIHRRSFIKNFVT